MAQSSRARLVSLLLSTRPTRLSLSHTKLFELLCVFPRVRSNERQRSKKRKSNEEQGVVVSRRFDDLQPTKRWNTQPIRINMAKTLYKNSKKKPHPATSVMVKALFSGTNIDRSCVQPGSENTMCPVYSQSPGQ